jgi:hypothetical protein
MDEGISTKAIPIRRSRSAGRGSVEQPSGLTGRLGSGLRSTVAPARSIWLASLGGTSFAIRGATAVWFSLISEGAAVERWLRGYIPGLPPQS